MWVYLFKVFQDLPFRVYLPLEDILDELPDEMSESFMQEGAMTWK